MKITLLLISILMFSFTSVQAETFQPTDWYVVSHEEGCVPMSVMHKEFPYFTGARTPEEWLYKVRHAPPGMDTPFGGGPQPDAELRPFTEVMQGVVGAEKFSEDPRFTKTNAVTLVSKKDPEGGLSFFRGDLCNALFNRGSK
ncbi:MAG TPA: hypothetical protein VEM15_16555 [Thermodesulfobacteriota bacterium]|nr:hypothetical protein [Thermodesulfobacteriota bacterium]